MDKTPYLVRNRIMGHSDETFTAEIATRLGYGLGTFFDKSAVVMTARDYRRDSRALKRSLTGGMLCSGIEIIDLHAIPTNVLQFIIRRFGADGGVILTRGHNLAGMVLLKIFDSTGIEIGRKQIQQIINNAESGNVHRVSNAEIGWVNRADSTAIYEKALIGYLSNYKELLKREKLRVVVDCANGPASQILPDLLSTFGCEIITLNSHRPKAPELFPSPKSLVRIAETVRATGSDIGIALDVEARHALIVDAQGQIHTPEETGAILLQTLEETNPHASIVIGESMNSSIYSNLNFNIVKSTNEEPGDLARKVFNIRAIIGVNDTGLYIKPSFSPGSDAILSAFMVMVQMTKEEVPLTTLYQKYSYYRQRLESAPFSQEEMKLFFEKIINEPPTDYWPIDTYCGVKLINKQKNAWIHYYICNDSSMIQIEIFDDNNNSNTLSELSLFSKDLIKHFKHND